MTYSSGINDHVFQDSWGIQNPGEDVWLSTSRFDEFLTPASKKPVARRLKGNRGVDERSQKAKKKRSPFWQIAPDGQTIERLYDPEQEPLDIHK